MERSVEGTHSLLARVLRRAPAAKMSYLSSELRFSQMVRDAFRGPSELSYLLKELTGVESLAGFRTCILTLACIVLHDPDISSLSKPLKIRSTLRLKPSNYLNAMSERELADLLYRDHAQLKRKRRQRFEAELNNQATANDNRDKQAQAALMNKVDRMQDSKQSLDDPVAMAIASYLTQASCMPFSQKPLNLRQPS